MGEILGNYALWLVLLGLSFAGLNRYQQKRQPNKLIRCVQHVLAMGIVLCVILPLTILLYKPVLIMFDINANGFMDMSGPFTAGILLSSLCLLTLGLFAKIRALLGVYYKTLRAMLLSIALFILLLILAVCMWSGLA